MKQVEVIKAKATIVDRSKGVGLGEKLRVAPYCRVSLFADSLENRHKIVKKNRLMKDGVIEEGLCGLFFKVFSSNKACVL